MVTASAPLVPFTAAVTSGDVRFGDGVTVCTERGEPAVRMSELEVLDTSLAELPGASVSEALVIVDNTVGMAIVSVAAGSLFIVSDGCDAALVTGAMGVNVLIVGVAEGAGLTVEAAGTFGSLVRVAVGSGTSVGRSTLGSAVGAGASLGRAVGFSFSPRDGSVVGVGGAVGLSGGPAGIQAVETASPTGGVALRNRQRTKKRRLISLPITPCPPLLTG